MKDSRFCVIIAVLMKFFVLWDITSLGVLYSTNVSELLAASIFKIQGNPAVCSEILTSMYQ